MSVRSAVTAARSRVTHSLIVQNGIAVAGSYTAGQAAGSAATPWVSRAGPPRCAIVRQQRLRDRATAPRIRKLDRHELVAKELVVLLERDRREEALRAAAQLEVVRRRGAVAGLERAAALQQDRLHVVGEELLHRIPGREVELADLACPGADRRVVAVVGAAELIPAGVAATARAHGQRHAQQLRVVDGVIHERPRLREVEGELVVVAAAGDVEVGLRRAVAAARGAAVAVEDRLHVGLERTEVRVRLVRGRIEAGRQGRRAVAVAGLRWGRRLEAVLGRAVLEPALQRVERVGARRQDRAARVLHVERQELPAVADLQDLRADRLDEQQRIRVRTERRQRVAPLRDVLVRRDVEVAGRELERIVGVRGVTAARVAAALLQQDRLNVALEERAPRSRITTARDGGRDDRGPEDCEDPAQLHARHSTPLERRKPRLVGAAFGQGSSVISVKLRE